MTVEKILYSFPETMTLLDVSRDTLNGWVESGQLPAINATIKKRGQKRRLKFRRTDIDAFLASRQVKVKGRKTPRQEPVLLVHRYKV